MTVPFHLVAGRRSHQLVELFPCLLVPQQRRLLVDVCVLHVLQRLRLGLEVAGARVYSVGQRESQSQDQGADNRQSSPGRQRGV